MKICIIANPNSVHVRRWAAYYMASHQIHLIGINPLVKSLPDPVIFYDLTEITNVRKVRYLVWALAMRRLMADIQPDIVHAHWVSGAGWIGAASGFHPFLVTVHGSDLLVLPKRSQIHRFLTRFVLNRADYITCVSEKLYDEILGYGINDSKIEIVKLGVDTSVFRPANRSESPDPEQDSNAQPLVVSIRALRTLYNPLDIARAIPLVLQKVPEAMFMIMTYSADKSLLTQFDNIIQDNGVSESVHYVEEMADDRAIARLYQSADVAVSVASSDGTPISVQEAMACAAPMVLGDIPAFHSWVRDGKEALFIPVNDFQALSEAIIRLLRDQELRNLISQIGLNYTRAHADRNRWMRRSEEIYRRLAGKTGLTNQEP